MIMKYSTLVWTELEFYMQYWAADLKKKIIIGESSEERQRNNKSFEKENI